MTDNVYDRVSKALTWKRIVVFNVVLLLGLVVPLTASLSQQSSENRTNASGEEAPVPIPPPNYPKVSPKLDRVMMFFGKVGDTVVLLGSNFGDYQWGSAIYVGNVRTTAKNIIKWTNSIIEVQIPEGARTGQVWIIVNGQKSMWEGSLLLYDVARAAQLGIRATDATVANIWVNKADATQRGMVEIGYVSEPIVIQPRSGIRITSQTTSLDVLGKKLKIEFVVDSTLPRGNANIIEVEHPQLGVIEILRGELFDSSNRLIEVFADPLSVKLYPR